VRKRKELAMSTASSRKGTPVSGENGKGLNIIERAAGGQGGVAELVNYGLVSHGGDDLQRERSKSRAGGESQSIDLCQNRRRFRG